MHCTCSHTYVGKLASFPGSPLPNSRPQTPPLLASHIQHPVQVKHWNSSIGNTSLVPRPHPARIASSIPDVILKAIRTGVGFGSGTETEGILNKFTNHEFQLCTSLGFDQIR